eukprot:6205891-Pleurochrysis_carterae.AAC.2
MQCVESSSGGSEGVSTASTSCRKALDAVRTDRVCAQSTCRTRPIAATSRLSLPSHMKKSKTSSYEHNVETTSQH